MASDTDAKVLQRVAALLPDESIQRLKSTLKRVTYADPKYTPLASEIGLQAPFIVCEPCQAFMCNPPPAAEYPNLEEPDDREIPLHCWQKHHDTLFQLIDCCYGSGSVSCRLCVRLLSELEQVMRLQLMEPMSNNWYTAPASTTRPFPVHDPHVEFKLCHLPWSPNPEDRSREGFLKANVAVRPDLEFKSHWLFLLIRPYFRSHAEVAESQHILPKRNDSDETIAQIKKWLSRCDGTHDLCDSSEEARKSIDGFPTRLMFWDSNIELVRLVDCATDPDIGGSLPMALLPEYLALSYRWGLRPRNTSVGPTVLPEILKLTRKTEAFFHQGIPLTDFPQTIQDAFHITIRLGYRYLWVDRLCIHQDSADDWNKESGRVGKVYRNARLTIAASGARYEDEGFLHSRGPTIARSKSLVFGSLNEQFLKPGWREDWKSLTPAPNVDGEPDAQQWRFGSFSMHGGNSALSKDSEGSLAHRGWIFQEMELSPRTVTFGAVQVHWTCIGMLCSETSPTPRPNNQIGQRPRLSSVYQPELHSAHRVWYELVEEYSKTKLSFPADRLSAVSGLAAYYAESLGIDEKDGQRADRYFAGIWESSFLKSLAWRRKYAEEDSDQVEPMSSSQLLPYLAPSWSWASLLGSIRYCAADLYWNEDYHGTSKDLALIEEVRLFPVGADSFGALQDGWVRLHGHVSYLSVQRSAPSDTFMVGQSYFISGAGGDEVLLKQLKNRPYEIYEDRELLAESSDDLIELLTLPFEVFVLPEEDSRSSDGKDDEDTSHDIQYLESTKAEVWYLLLAPVSSTQEDRLKQAGNLRPEEEEEAVSSGEYRRIGIMKVGFDGGEAWNAYLKDGSGLSVTIK